MRIKYLSSLFISITILIFLGSCQTTQEDIIEKAHKNLRPGKFVDFFWLDDDVNFSDLKSIHIPDYNKDQNAKENDWINENILEQIAVYLLEWHVFDRIDRTPSARSVWTDLTLRINTYYSLPQEGGSKEQVECILEDNRSNKLIAVIQHHQTITFDSVALKTIPGYLVKDLAKDIAQFLKSLRDRDKR